MSVIVWLLIRMCHLQTACGMSVQLDDIDQVLVNATMWSWAAGHPTKSSQPRYVPGEDLGMTRSKYIAFVFNLGSFLS
jgi:hypothetical protein